MMHAARYSHEFVTLLTTKVPFRCAFDDSSCWEGGGGNLNMFCPLSSIYSLNIGSSCRRTVRDKESNGCAACCEAIESTVTLHVEWL